MRLTFTLVPATFAAIAVTACSAGPPSSGDATASSADGKVAVWATTSVWGAVAQAVGGNNVTVTSAISRSDQDPHDYEVTARDKVAVDKAAVAVVNGGGYDDWAVDLVAQAPNKPAVVNAVDLSGLKPAGSSPASADSRDEHAGHAHAEFNEHVFYSLPTVKKVAAQVATDLGRKDPARAADYTKNAQTFSAEVDGLTAKARKIGSAAPDATAISTEPVAGHLLQSAGVHDITPEAFVTGSESSAGPSVAALQETTQRITTKKSDVLVLNAQTEDDASKRLRGAADAAGIATVQVSETFPDGVTDYVAWIDSALSALSGALVRK